VALTFSLPAALGAYLGTVANGEVSPRTLILAFVPVTLRAAVLTYRRGDSAEEPGVAGECPKPSIVRAGGGGLVVGLMTGFFGVGGVLIVPALTILLGLMMRRAIATSLAIITLTGGGGTDQPPGDGRSAGLAADTRAQRCGRRRGARGQRDRAPPPAHDIGPRIRSGGSDRRVLPLD
jgi:hypothetical protein